MQTRLFWWFAAAIVVTVLAAMAVFSVFGDGGRSWRAQLERLESFTAGRYAYVWRNPAQRRELSASIARDLHLGVRTHDARGALLESERYPRDCDASRSIAIQDHGEPLGSVELCLDGIRKPGTPVQIILALAAMALVLWVASGVAARRIARPLRELARVARELGEGKLESRASIRHGQTGEIGELARVMNDMAARIEAQLRDQRALLAAVSHELRTPLARVRIVVETAREQGATPETFDALEKEAIEMDALVGDLLAGARIDFSALSKRRLDVRELCLRAIEAAAAGDISFEAGAAAGELEGDATLLTRALVGLVDNARKHGGPDILLRVRDEGGHVVFEVADDGPGIPAGEAERIFEPFYRGASNDGRVVRGVGLGLALVRRIAELHGGTASAAARDGGGTKIWMRLPRRI